MWNQSLKKEPQSIAVLEKFKDNDINAMSIIVDLSKKMFDSLTNFFLVRNIGQVMSLKNQIYDMKMNDDESITSYFVRISRLR